MQSNPRHGKKWIGLVQHLPRFQPENIEKNAQIFERVNAMTIRKGCTASQLALAWVHHQGSDVCPIPGTTKIENFNQNVGALSMELTPEEMAELEFYAAAGNVHGDRYPQMSNTWQQKIPRPFPCHLGKPSNHFRFAQLETAGIFGSNQLNKRAY